MFFRQFFFSNTKSQWMEAASKTVLSWHSMTYAHLQAVLQRIIASSACVSSTHTTIIITDINEEKKNLIEITLVPIH